MAAIEMTLMDEPDRLRVALTPIRRRLLARLREPASAVQLAAEFDLPRQRVGYHLRVLEEVGLVELVEERPRRGFVERVMGVTANAFLVDPGVLDAPDKAPEADGASGADEATGVDGVTEAGGVTGGARVGGAGETGGGGGEFTGLTGLTGAAEVAQVAQVAGAAGEFRRVADQYAAEHLVEVAAGTVRDVARMAAAADRQGVRLLTFTLEARVRFAEPGDVHDFTDALADALSRVAARFDTPGGRPYRLVAGGHPAPGVPGARESVGPSAPGTPEAAASPFPGAGEGAGRPAPGSPDIDR
ncbi:helix-turn-helix domain-containing protein [Streptosporangium sp. V21-05]|uniref:helix-turn-helix domain-containing protein n=1 Tax=Streptosporangium sp. V21-05 TaxID=3446115 RepID=UPI003F5314C7